MGWGTINNAPSDDWITTIGLPISNINLHNVCHCIHVWQNRRIINHRAFLSLSLFYLFISFCLNISVTHLIPRALMPTIVLFLCFHSHLCLQQVSKSEKRSCPLNPHYASFCISEECLNFLHLDVLELNYQGTVWIITISFFHWSPTSSHLHPLQVENCDSNARLVMDEDDNGNFRPERVESVKLIRDPNKAWSSRSQ